MFYFMQTVEFIENMKKGDKVLIFTGRKATLVTVI